MSDILPPRPKRSGSHAITTHTRIYVDTLDDLRQVATDWNTTILEVQRFLADLAKNKIVTPETQPERRSMP